MFAVWIVLTLLQIWTVLQLKAHRIYRTHSALLRLGTLALTIATAVIIAMEIIILKQVGLLPHLPGNTTFSQTLWGLFNLEHLSKL